MASKEIWKHFQTSGFLKGTDEDLLSMIQDVVDTIRLLERMFSQHQAALVISGLIPTYTSLSSIAFSRNLKNIPSL